mmetsp:Transcript_21143/g.65542  ORF Transcript_21143/g.65542 Transcript_21143/m.65542 type:complete len:206 (-) Transcript_21143:177-794(-)
MRGNEARELPRKGAQILTQALRVADDRQHRGPPGHARRIGRHEHPCLGHQRRQAHRLQHGGLAPRVRPRNHHSGRLGIKRHVKGHRWRWPSCGRLLLVFALPLGCRRRQRRGKHDGVAHALQSQPRVYKLGLHCTKPCRVLRPRLREVGQLYPALRREHGVLACHHRRAQLAQHALRLRLYFGAQALELVVDGGGLCGLDVRGRA